MFFLSFSDFIMRGFDRASDASAVECMQCLNRTVYHSIFSTVFCFVPISIGLALYTGDSLAYGSSAVYILSVFLITAFGNVPMNKSLDRLDAKDSTAREYWHKYTRILDSP